MNINMLLKNKCFFKQNNYSEKSDTVLQFLKISLMVGLTDDWIVVSTFILTIFYYMSYNIWKTLAYTYEKIKVRKANAIMGLL
jgi:hypothetical protein